MKWANGLMMCASMVIGPDVRGADPGSNLSGIRWLIGQWTCVTGTSVTTEVWVEASSRTFEGKGETRSPDGKTLLSSETLRLVEMSGEVFYLAKVAHNAFPTPFKLIESSGTRAVFVHETHDFPKRIEYVLEAGDRLTAHVSDGGGKGFSIAFRR